VYQNNIIVKRQFLLKLLIVEDVVTL